MLDIYKLNNVSSDELVAGIAFFQSICLSGKELPEDVLDFYEMFYLVQIRKPKDQVEEYYFKFLLGYALNYEGEIMEELMEPNGLYEASLQSDFVAQELFQLSDYFIKADSGDKEYWKVINEDMREVIASRAS